MNTKQFGTGAIPSPIDTRDHQWGVVAKGEIPFDWNNGFDVEELYGFQLKTKDQNGSYSCGGQAWAYYGEALEYRSDLSYEPRSAKFIYSQTFVPSGGSNGRDNCKVVQVQGWAEEKLCPSYQDGNPPNEAFMTRPQDITQEARNNARQVQALNYAQVNLNNIDEIAQAIKVNNGVVIGIYGKNNGTWLSTFPKADTPHEWAHWLYAGKAKLINGKKYIGVKNSWGDGVGDHGWQWLSEDFFPSAVFEIWTVYFKQDVQAMQASIWKRILQLIADFLSRQLSTMK